MNSKVSIRTSFLFAQPSFASGIARGLDLYGSFDSYNTSTSEVDADRRAIANDWLAVGEDFTNVLERTQPR